MVRRPTLTIQQALQKARHYCAYQDRCHSEVREKLYSLGLWKNDVEAALASLIEDDYLNEERYAIQFAGGRFRMKGWGRVKIRYELKQKQIGEYNIKKALAAIDAEDYNRTLDKLAADKWKTLGEEANLLLRRKKLQGYLLQRGFETDCVAGALERVAKPGSAS